MFPVLDMKTSATFLTVQATRKTTQTKMIMVDRSKPGVTLITMSLTDTMRAITTWSKSKEQTTHCEMKQSMTTLFVTEKITPAPLSLECLAKPHATQLRRSSSKMLCKKMKNTRGTEKTLRGVLDVPAEHTISS